MGQMESWLLDGDVQRLVVVVSGVDSGETLERWQFNVQVDKQKGLSSSTTGDENQAQNASVVGGAAPKTIKEIHNEIQAIIRQITASVRVYECVWSVVIYMYSRESLTRKRCVLSSCHRLHFCHS